MASSSYSQTQCSSVLASPPTRYDVFLSFRGIDTRYTFTDYLYDSLQRSGIKTFRDDPELRSGEVISDSLLQAIRESKTYVVIFSKNYASSPWCLDELVEILSYHQTMKRSLISVFYKIDPSVVRHQTGSFKEAFEKHQIRFDMDRLNNWRITLTRVADLKGYHVLKNMSQTDIINKVVDRVLLEVNPWTLDVAKYPVGLDSRVKGITTFLSSNAEGVTKIGINGMGGIGKTTLAKAVYNKISQKFQGSCFLANVREVSGTPKGLVSLQRQLINDVLKCKNTDIDNVDQGIELIRARICSTKVLIVIDDLDDPMPLEYLVGPFALGSTVIITTRNEDLLDSIKVELRYKVNELSDAESRQLFTQHAFGNNEISDEFVKLSEEILDRAGGLPLALKVFGSNLFNQSEEGWRWFIDKLKRVPIGDVEKKLVISFEALKLVDPMLQDIFLDIACFFIRRKKEEAVKIMETCYTFVNRNIDILKKRCLLTTNGRDELEMHDLFLSMGREIARNNSLHEPGKHSRLWKWSDIRDVLKKHKGTEVIEGIIPDNFYSDNPFEEEVSFSTETFKGMSRLRYLYLRNVNLFGSFEHAFDNLRLLCWKYFPLKSLPSDFFPQKLVILDLPISKLSTMWEPNKIFEELKTLNLSYSRDLTTTPDFSNLPYLETLNFEDCMSLEEVHISIGNLARLVSLNLRRCMSLKSLPDSICNLRTLESLDINSCIHMEALPIELGNIGSLTEISACSVAVSKLPDSIRHLSKLVKLRLGYSKKLVMLPDAICDLRALKFLDISFCSSLVVLPTELGNIISLTVLEASAVNISELPSSIAHLSNLVELRLEFNKNLETLPNSICSSRSLEILDITGCKKLEILPDKVWKLTRLRKLDARGCTMLKKLPDIESNQNPSLLKKLGLSETAITSLPSGISHLLNLEKLDLRNCRRLLSISELPPNLTWISTEGCTSLETLPNLSNLKQLEDLDLRNCSGLRKIQGLKEFTSIKTIRFGGCSPSLVANTLTKHVFQIYSGFQHQVQIYTESAEFLDWVNQSSYLESEVSLVLPMNVSHNFLATILCFKAGNKLSRYSVKATYSLKNATSGFILRGPFYAKYPESLITIVPSSVFVVSDGDHSIELTATAETILGIHLLYKPGKYPTTIVNVDKERNHPSKRLKCVESDS